MENIVTGEDTNLPNNTEQGQLVPTPSEEPVSIFDNAATASAFYVQDALQGSPQPQEQGSIPEDTNTPDDGMMRAVEPASPNGEVSSAGLPFQAVTPMVSVGVPPWLMGNPNVQPVYPDLPNWREQIRQTQLDAAFPDRPERTILDIPYTYSQFQRPMLDEQTGSNLESIFDRVQSRHNSIRLRSELNRLVDYRPYQHVPPSNQLNSNTSVPGSNRGILRNNPRYQGDLPESQRDGNLFTNFGRDWWDRSREQINILTSPVRDLWNLLTGGEGSEEQREALNNLTYEYVLGNPVTGESAGEPINNALDTIGQLANMFPQTTENVLGTLEENAGVPDASNPSGYRSDWVNGYFGEYGRGWVGALNTALSYTENIGMAAVYSVADLGVALTNQLPIDVPGISEIDVDFDDVLSGYRFRQAFSGLDLDITNVRDGNGNRYLNIIDPNADRQTQIQQAALGLTISTLYGGSIDDALMGGMRFSRVFGESIRRGMSPGDALEATRRTLRVQDLRRTRQSVPQFSAEEPTPPATFTSENPNVPILNNPNPVQGELPPVSPAAGVVINLDEYTNPVLTPDFSAGNISPSQIAQEFELDPMATPPLPFFAPRTNDELLRLGQNLGVIDPEQNILTNSDIARLQQVYGGAFSRFGPPIEPTLPNPNYLDVPPGTPENNGVHTVTEIVSPNFPNYVISAPPGYRLPDGYEVDEIFAEIQNRAAADSESIDWTLMELIDDGLVPWTDEAAIAYSQAMQEAIPGLKYGVIMQRSEVDSDSFMATTMEGVVDHARELQPVFEQNNVQAMVVAHGTGMAQDPDNWVNVVRGDSWRNVIDTEFPPGTRVAILSCSKERLAYGTMADTQWVILESGNPSYMEFGEGNYVNLPADWQEDMAMFEPRAVTPEEIAEENYMLRPTDGAEGYTEAVEWDWDAIRETIRGGMNFPNNAELYNEMLSQYWRNRSSDYSVPPTTRVPFEQQFRLQTSQNEAIRNIGEPGPEEVQRLNNMLDLEQADNYGPTVRWMQEEAPNNMTGTVELADDYLETMDDFSGASRGLQDLELEIDNLRRDVIKRGQRLVGNGDLANYGRGAINDEVTTYTQYGGVVPGTQVQELLPPLDYTPSIRTSSIDANTLDYGVYPPRTAKEISEFSNYLPEFESLTPDARQRFLNNSNELIQKARLAFGNIPDDAPGAARFRKAQAAYRAWLNNPGDAIYGDATVNSYINNWKANTKGLKFTSTPPEQPWYHGTKQIGIDRVNFHHGAAHEWGVGLYLTSDATYANVAARSARVQNNPVPGTTRLRPDGTGAVYQIEANTSRMLDALAPVEPGTLKQFQDSVRTIFGKRFSEYWNENIGTPLNGDIWVNTRELYAELYGSRIPELRYREFSREVSNKLTRTGYQGIEDSVRGQRLLFPNEDGRIPMRANPVQEGVGSDSKLEAMYARRWMDAELSQRIDSPVTEAWELQSRVKLENAMMEKLFESYNPANAETMRLLDEMLQQERQLEADTRALREMDIEDIISTADTAAMSTPQFERFRDTPLDDPCI